MQSSGPGQDADRVPWIPIVDHFEFMDVPNSEKIVDDSLSPLAFNSTGDSQALWAAFKKGQEKERGRILKRIHDKVSPKLLSAVFLAQIVKEKLEAKELEERVMAAGISDALIKVIDGLVEVLDAPFQPLVEETRTGESSLTAHTGRVP